MAGHLAVLSAEPLSGVLAKLERVRERAAALHGYAGRVDQAGGPDRLTEAAWKRRHRAPRFTYPQGARDAPDRVVYAANRGALVVDEQPKQVAMELDLVARSLGITPAIA